MNSYFMRSIAFPLCLMGAIGASRALADEPQPEGPPASTEWGLMKPLDQAIYHSDALDANFIAQWMYIDQGPMHYEFWGARIVGIGPNSPLNQIDLRAGDVITRLDGVPISRGMRKRHDGWSIPELERHFGGTEVRHIHQGSQFVEVDMININLFQSNGSSPVRP